MILSIIYAINRHQLNHQRHCHCRLNALAHISTISVVVRTCLGTSPWPFLLFSFFFFKRKEKKRNTVDNGRRLNSRTNLYFVLYFFFLSLSPYAQGEEKKKGNERVFLSLSHTPMDHTHTYPSKNPSGPSQPSPAHQPIAHKNARFLSPCPMHTHTHTHIHTRGCEVKAARTFPPFLSLFFSIKHKQ
ncbi:hypothetical protein BD289DRAFT_94625 [Coniella lustricola]|uniref:Uncharacterized protein n=1 Tax=Coniella lustricola TaxID=2025994 RepID=A0A2T2ZY66_9PEZI|nr:hypothetical protein BD289DRAFT_94625 [Coniella lustricola]